MKRKLFSWLGLSASFLILLATAIAVNQLYSLSLVIGGIIPYAGHAFLAFWAIFILVWAAGAYRLWAAPKVPPLADKEGGKNFEAYIAYLSKSLTVHPAHPEAGKRERDLRWVKTDLKFLEVDALNATKTVATKNFFIGAFAQNTSYGTTTSLLNNLKLIWSIYAMYHRKHSIKEFLLILRSVYACLPLSDFNKEELPLHIKPIIQCAFSNTLSSLLPGGNLLTPFFLNLFLAGATNTYLTCLAGIITARHCQVLSLEDKQEIVQQSMFEASFMLREIVKESNPVLSVTISNAVKKAGIESLDTVTNPSPGSSVAQDIVSHLANSIKHIMRETGKE
ncbi:MAG: hypothetical protein HGB00_09045 [Chlorobiaceae bacterium]|nr:hypothetical protein [Chlorobiaceae bacterium]